jgi:predicted CopG family antitoxin
MASTTIAVSMETKEMLRHFGEKGESYDEIIRKLIEEVGIKELDSRWNKILADDKFIPLDEL